MRLALFVALGTFAILLSDCEVSTVEAFRANPNQRTATDAGVSVRGPINSPYAGIDFQAPPGAINTGTAVSFEGTVEDVPLPLPFVRVGPRIRLRPTGLMLNVAGTLTLPIEKTPLDAYGITSRVTGWGFANGAWEQILPTETSATSATLPITRFSTFTLGAEVTVPSSSCRSASERCAPMPAYVEHVADLESESCRAPGRSCLLSLPIIGGTESFDEFSSITVVQQTAYWLVPVWNEKHEFAGVTVAKYGLYDGGTVSVSPICRATSYGPIESVGRVALGTNKEPWAGIRGMGNLRFAEAGCEVFDHEGPLSKKVPSGVIESPRGQIRRFATSPGPFVIADAGPNSEVGDASLLTAPTEMNLYVRPNRGDSPQYVFRIANGRTESISGTSIDTVGGTDAVLGSSVCGATRLFGMNNSIPFNTQVLGSDPYSHCDAHFIGFANVGSVAALATADGQRIFIHSEIRSLEPRLRYVSFVGPVSDLAFVADGRLFGIGAGRAEVQVLETDNSRRSIPLASNTDDIRSPMAPLRIRAIDGTNDLLIVTRGHDRKGRFTILRAR